MATLRVFSFLRLAALAPIAAVVAACSSTTPAVPQAGISVTVLPGNNTSQQCPIVGEDSTWNIGGSNLSPVVDQGSQGNSRVDVSCSVKAQGSGYAVTGDVELSGAGSFTISGTFDGTTNTQNNITATFVLPGGLGNWTESTCSVTFPNGGMGIAAGRVWAAIDCPTMKDSSHGTQCDGNAQFRFENCNQ